MSSRVRVLVRRRARWLLAAVALTIFLSGGITYLATIGVSTGSFETIDSEPFSRTDSRPLATTVSAPPQTTTATVGPPPPAPPSLFFAVDRALRRMAFARLAFNAPTSVRLGDTVTIQLVLSPTESIHQLQMAVTAPGRTEGARIRVSDFMQARLTGFGFKIQALAPERQPVSTSGTTEWEWSIEATQDGSHTLDLTLWGVISVGNLATPRLVRTFQRTLIVRVTWLHKTSQFVAHNWEWLWTTVFFPGLVWFVRRRRTSSMTTSVG